MTHHPAAFINAIAEEGSKAEAIEWLQKTWNENCDLRAALRDIISTAQDAHATGRLERVAEIAGQALGDGT